MQYEGSGHEAVAVGSAQAGVLIACEMQCFAGVLKRLACEPIENDRVAHAFASQIRPNG